MAFRTVEDMRGMSDPSRSCENIGMPIILCSAYGFDRRVGHQRNSPRKGCLEVLEDARDHTIRPCGSCFANEGAFGIADSILLENVRVYGNISM